MASASGSSALDSISLRDNYIPQFDGQPQSYREWRKSVNIYHHDGLAEGESVLSIGSLR